MVNTLVYWSGKPIGMRRRATLGLQAQAVLLIGAIVAFLTLAGLRATDFGRDQAVFSLRRGAGAEFTPVAHQAPVRPIAHRLPVRPIVLHGDYSAASTLVPLYPYSRQIQHVAIRYGLPPDLVAGVVQTESQFDPRCVSPVGAEGLMQLMPSTAELLAHNLGWHHFNLFDPGENLVLGTYFLKDLLVQFGDIRTALSYYNAGQWGIVSRGVYRNRRYIRAVLTHYHQFGSEHRAMLMVTPVLGHLQVEPIMAAE